MKETRTVPVVAMRDSVVFPHTDPILSFGRPKSIAAVRASFEQDRVVAIFTQKSSKLVDPSSRDLYKEGTIATITQIMSSEGGEIHAVVHGQARIYLEEVIAHEPYILAKIREVPEEDMGGDDVVALTRKAQELFKKAINLGKGVEINTVMKTLAGQADPVEIADSISSTLEIKTSQRQKLLANPSVRERLSAVVEHLNHEVNVLELEKTISNKTQKRFEDQMRKAMLREKKRTIEQELGEDIEEGADEEIKEYRKKIKEAKMPRDVRKKALKELSRLNQMSVHNPEGGYLRNYLDWLCEMPWSKLSPNNVSIKKAHKALDDDHFGLDKTKERILEYLAVMKVKSEARGSKDKKSNDGEEHPTILCFVGPPGVGKTSIGKSIARALGRKFVRVSLGGIRDEAEIRGHRRTYVGALPGRIIQGIRNAETRNPVFMLDEIDKVGADFRGDPTSALLEALDPEQNREFSDHYLEVPFDLSQVMFICTANVLDTIPEPLRDRMEIIKFPGYIESEKFSIAKKYLWPKQKRVHGVSDRKIDLEPAALRLVIEKYTREAGVRNLERNLATIVRKIVTKIAEKKRYPNKVKVSDVRKFLGAAKFSSLIAEKKNEAGMSTGLAVTSTGGEILFIEVAIMPGRGKLTLTGQLGDVMKESAKAAFTWTKSHYKELGLSEGFGNSIDVHIHVPEGATPKDGPSAGVAMGTALTSALTKIPVNRMVGMTGEITLRGRVLEIGGVKEKVIAAHRAGLKKVILPKDNKKDMEEIPDNVKKEIEFVFASKLEDVLREALTIYPLVKRETRISRRAPVFVGV